MKLLVSFAALLVAALALLAARVPARGGQDRLALESVEVVSETFELVRDDGSVELLDRRLLLRGRGFFGTSFGPWVRVHDPAAGAPVEAPWVVLLGEGLIEVRLPAGLRGRRVVEVEVPGGERAGVAVDLR